ncbi:trypsin-like peptidase domain-containing protein [Psychroflexus planctonicus]|uniref:Serine protease n=1 Tax=Psychroflexus planctonicus TaxID=1526575 RepID=A0ABQ1SKG7_9FLAO|nr:trypsin-like peptidase domain-containing protein [Psychroflexus planctonicus]GGE43834.1 serine protease [Psychroflexus planctonicus]
MKKFIGLFLVSCLAGSITLIGYKSFFEKELANTPFEETQFEQAVVPTSYPAFTNEENSELPDFSIAAENTVHAVVHVKNLSTARMPRNIFEYHFGNGPERKAVRGMGSGVIISPDGLIVTNNHVIEGATEVEITLNNNEVYQAEIIGQVPENDLAVLKIDGEDLEFLTFGDSNQLKLGEWVLAVGNPFNLTSTVTAGIVSAKARNLDPRKAGMQSFIQTDAAVNPGNSGGALVNKRGELIGINTAITSQTGSFVGYSFAIPSNNARKIIEDIMEFGNVRKAVLGVRGVDLDGKNAKELSLDITQGFYIGSIDDDSGAAKSGLKEGDIIQKIDGIKIRKFSDLTGYISTKNPGEVVQVHYLRNGKTKQTEVELSIFEVYKIEDLGIEVSNASTSELEDFKAEYGVRINRVTSQRLASENLTGILITKINDTPVKSVKDVEKVVSEKAISDPLKVTFKAPNGEEMTYIFR